MPVFLFQFPHVLVRRLHVVITDLFQHLLQKRLQHSHTQFYCQESTSSWNILWHSLNNPHSYKKSSYTNQTWAWT